MQRVRRTAIAVALVLVACSEASPSSTTGPTATAAVPESLVVLSHESFAAGVTEETFAEFTDATGITVEVLAAGDAGATLNQAILTKDAPLGDVLFGVDTTFLSRALDEDLFAVHEAALLTDVPEDLQTDPSHRVTPIDFGDVCINYDKQGLAAAGLEPPAALSDLTRPEYRSTLVVEHPATSSPGLAFLLATIAEFGEEGWADFWAKLRDNDVAVTAGWDEAYYSSFSGGSGEGDRPLVVSYASSPPAEVIFSEEPVDEAPTGVVTAGCYRQIEFAGVLAHTGNEAAAGDLVDFMLSPAFQEQIPLAWFVFPANQTVDLPPEFSAHTVVPESPAAIEPDDIESNRETWITEWEELMEG
jgi:thiamine transport system substrate-binding protein